MGCTGGRCGGVSFGVAAAAQAAGGAGPKLDPVKALIDEILTAGLYAPRKQRHTARRIHS